VARKGRFFSRLGRGDPSESDFALTPAMVSALREVQVLSGVSSMSEALRRAIALFAYLQRRSGSHDLIVRDRGTGAEQTISLVTRQDLRRSNPAVVAATLERQHDADEAATFVRQQHAAEVKGSATSLRDAPSSKPDVGYE
jgi:precorrin-6B methylase 1